MGSEGGDALTALVTVLPGGEEQWGALTFRSGCHHLTSRCVKAVTSM